VNEIAKYRLRAAGRRWPVAAAAGLGALLALSGAPAAQTDPDPRRETERAVPPLGPETEAERLAREAETRRLFEGRDVSYDEVLRRPDDLELNLLFARTLIRQGDLLGALAALERLLLVNPQQPRVRLLYAVVLYRLNALAEAERELDRVLAFQMPPGLRSELEHYRSEVRRQQRQTQFSLLLRLGYRYDSNRSAQPIDRFFDTSGGPVAAGGADPDHAFTSIVRFDVAHDLRFNRRHRLLGSATLFFDQSLRRDAFNARAYEISGGPSLDFNPVEVTLLPRFRQTYLGGSLGLSAGGGVARAEWTTRRDLAFFATFEGEDQVYNDSARFNRANLRSGVYLAGAVGVRWIVNPRHRLTATVGGQRKFAREDFYAYAGPALTLEHGWLLGRGAYVLTRASWNRDSYDAADPTISATRRVDNVYRIGTQIGAPFATISGWDDAPRPLRDVTFSAGFEYARTQSNVRNYSYESFRAMLSVTKRFEF
jgi:tetratricopeptide (TPR) repeat protein